jgi:hypothetical protein
MMLPTKKEFKDAPREIQFYWCPVCDRITRITEGVTAEAIRHCIICVGKLMVTQLVIKGET